MSPGGKNGSLCKDIHHTRVSILEAGRLFKSIAHHLVELELYMWVLFFVVFVPSILAEPPASLPSRTLSPKALLNSFDTHQGVKRKRNALYLYSNDNIYLYHKRMTKSLLCGWLVMLAVVHIVYILCDTALLLVVVVHDINKKKRTGIDYRKARLIPYQERKTLERRCAEDSV